MLLDGLDEPPEVSILLSLLNVGRIVVLRFLFEFQVALVSSLAEITCLDGEKNCTTRFLHMSAV